MSQQWQERYAGAVMNTFGPPKLVLVRGEGAHVWDADGNQYLDFFGGIVTISVGHCNDEVNKKVKAQMDTLEHVSTAYITAPQVELAQKIAPKTPGDGALSKFYFTNSGTEANETAFLTARLATGSQRSGPRCGRSRSRPSPPGRSTSSPAGTPS